MLCQKQNLSCPEFHPLIIVGRPREVKRSLGWRLILSPVLQRMLGLRD